MADAAMAEGLVPVPVASEETAGLQRLKLGQSELPPSPADAKCVCCHETWQIRPCNVPVRLTATGWLTGSAVLLTGLFFLAMYDANPLSLLAAYGVNALVFWRLWWAHPERRGSADADMLVKVFGLTFFFGVGIALVFEQILIVIGAVLLIPDSIGLAQDIMGAQDNLTNSWYIDRGYDPSGVSTHKQSLLPRDVSERLMVGTERAAAAAALRCAEEHHRTGRGPHQRPRKAP